MAKYRIIQEVQPYSGDPLFKVYFNEGFPFGWDFIGFRDSLDEAKRVIEIHKNNPVYEE